MLHSEKRKGHLNNKNVFIGLITIHMVEEVVLTLS